MGWFRSLKICPRQMIQAASKWLYFAPRRVARRPDYRPAGDVAAAGRGTRDGGCIYQTFSESRVPRGEVSPLGFPLHFRGVGYPCCQIAAWIPRPENANNSTVLHPQSRGVVTARLEYIQQYLPDGNQGPYTICSVSWFPCCRLPASAGWSCCRHRTFPLIGVWKSRFPSSYPTVYRK